MNAWLAAEVLCLLSFTGFGLVVMAVSREVDARRAQAAMIATGFLGVICFLMVWSSDH